MSDEANRDEIEAYFRELGFGEVDMRRVSRAGPMLARRYEIRDDGHDFVVSANFMEATMRLHRALLASIDAHEKLGGELEEIRDATRELVERAGEIAGG
jgi:hypothetical protein